MEQILEVKHLGVTFKNPTGNIYAVRDLSFHIGKGECIALVGESGCGKSVTARAVMGLTEYTGGTVDGKSEIIYREKNILKNSPKEWQQFRGKSCSIIFQDSMSCLNPTMKVGRQITESLYLHRHMKGAEAWNEAIRIMQLVGIQDAEKRIHAYPHELSGGMRQRVMIAVALACHPDVLIADEPTTALDVTTQAQIMKLLKELQKTLHMAILIITHDLGIVANIADRIYVMYGGQIVEKGTAEEIFFGNKHPYTAALLNAVPRLDLECGQKLESIEGTPPALYAIPPGCLFAPRCKYCMNICQKRPPEIFAFSENHQAACWKYHPQSFYREKED